MNTQLSKEIATLFAQGKIVDLSHLIAENLPAAWRDPYAIADTGLELLHRAEPGAALCAVKNGIPDPLDDDG